MDTILEIQNLKKYYPILGGVLRRPVNVVKALDDVSLDIRRGECLGVVGESGCGKTTAGKAILRLHDPTSGRLIYHPRDSDESFDIASMSPGEMKRRDIRHKLQMVFQDPTTSMNPRMLIKNIIAEPIRERERLGARDMEARVVDLLRLVGLTSDHLLRYPHEFSGGQRQRIAVARAIATNPEFLVMDEPTSALDVSVQAQILNLLSELRQKLNLTYMFVTHHLLVVKYISTRIAVMYLGKLVELAETEDLFARPLHPYTHALLSGIPNPDVNITRQRILLEGDVPSPLNPPDGCRFHTRCPFRIDVCRVSEPRIRDVPDGGREHKVACHRAEEIARLVGDKYGTGNHC